MKIFIDDIEINFEKKGKGHPLLMLHGNGEDLHIFDELSEALKEHFTIYSLDSRNHGKSSKTEDYAYEIMAFDVLKFMGKLRIEQPYILGFSDGGIVALLLSIAFPDLIPKMVIAGANISPKGFRPRVHQALLKHYEQTKDPLYQMMLTQPNIRHQDLHRITSDTLILAGEHDMIQKRHTTSIHHHIKASKLKILENKNHDNYIIKSDMLKDILIEFFK